MAAPLEPDRNCPPLPPPRGFPREQQDVRAKLAQRARALLRGRGRGTPGRRAGARPAGAPIGRGAHSRVMPPGRSCIRRFGNSAGPTATTPRTPGTDFVSWVAGSRTPFDAYRLGTAPSVRRSGACRPFLASELAALKKVRAIVALGTVAHSAVLDALDIRRKLFPFRHGAFHQLRDSLMLADSYHCLPLQREYPVG